MKILNIGPESTFIWNSNSGGICRNCMHITKFTILIFVICKSQNEPMSQNIDLSAEEKGIINAAVSTIDSWNTLCEQGVSIAMANDPDIQCINTVNQKLKQTTQTLSNATSLLKSKLSAFNLKSN